MKRNFTDLKIEIIELIDVDVITESLVGWWLEDQESEETVGA